MDKNQLINELQKLAASDKQAFLDVLQAVLDADLWLAFNQLQEGEEAYKSAVLLEEERNALIEKIREESFKRFEKVYKALA